MAGTPTCLGITKKAERCKWAVNPNTDGGGGYCHHHQAQRPGAPLQPPPSAPTTPPAPSPAPSPTPRPATDAAAAAAPAPIAPPATAPGRGRSTGAAPLRRPYTTAAAAAETADSTPDSSPDSSDADAPGDASSSGIRTVATWNLNLDRWLSMSRDVCAAKMASLMTLLESRNISLCCLQEFALRGPCAIPNFPAEYAAGEAFAVSAFYAAAARARNGRRWQLKTVCVGPGGVGEVHAFVWDDDVIEALGTPWRLFAPEPVAEPPAETGATGATTGVPGTPRPSLKRSPSAGRFRARGPGASDTVNDSITDSGNDSITDSRRVPLSFTAVCVHVCSSSAENGGLAGVRAEVAFLWPAVQDQLSSVRDSEPESVILLGDFNLGPPAVAGLAREPSALGAWGALEPHFVRCESPEPTNLERLAARRDCFFYDHVLLASPLARRCRMTRGEAQATVVKIDDEAIAAHFGLERGRGSQREYEGAIEAKVIAYKAHLKGNKTRNDHGKFFSKRGGSDHRPVTIRLPSWIEQEDARGRGDDALAWEVGVVGEGVAGMGLGR